MKRLLVIALVLFVQLSHVLCNEPLKQKQPVVIDLDKQEILKDLIKIDKTEKQRILKFEAGSNPVLLLYKVKTANK